MNMRWLNFPFQPNINAETTLSHRRWIDVILSTLFQRCFVNVETTSINVRRLNFHFQPNINVETTSMNVDDQRCFNVDSTLMCLLGHASDCWTIVPATSEQLCQQLLKNSGSHCWGIMQVTVEQSCHWLLNNRASGCWTIVPVTIEQWCQQLEESCQPLLKNHATE